MRSEEDIRREILFLAGELNKLYEKEAKYMYTFNWSEVEIYDHFEYKGHITGRICALDAVLESTNNGFFIDSDSNK